MNNPPRFPNGSTLPSYITDKTHPNDPSKHSLDMAVHLTAEEEAERRRIAKDGANPPLPQPIDPGKNRSDELPRPGDASKGINPQTPHAVERTVYETDPGPAYSVSPQIAPKGVEVVPATAASDAALEGKVVDNRLASANVPAGTTTSGLSPAATPAAPVPERTKYDTNSPTAKDVSRAGK